MDKAPVQSLTTTSALSDNKLMTLGADLTSQNRNSGDNPIRLLSKSLLIALLAFELLPLAFKLADLLFFFRIDEADLVIFSLGTNFAAVCNDASAKPPSFIDEKESSEKFFDTALQFIQKRIPELLLPVAAGLIMLMFFVDAVSGMGNSDVIKWITSVIEPKR